MLQWTHIFVVKILLVDTPLFFFFFVMWSNFHTFSLSHRISRWFVCEVFGKTNCGRGNLVSSCVWEYMCNCNRSG